ncbi:MAG: MFS transporter, partial [Mycobacterium sp.]
YLHAESAYMDLVWPFLVTSTGIGLCVAPTTSAIMNAVPTEKQGVASAVNDTTREIGAAVGIAVAGSVLAAQYANALAPGLSAFPAQVRGAATESLANALEVAKQLGPQGPALARLAESAFRDAMDLSLIVVSAVLVVAAAFVAVWAPGRDGRQLRLVGRLTARRSPDDELGRAMSEHDDRGVRTAARDGRQDRAVDDP